LFLTGKLIGFLKNPESGKGERRERTELLERGRVKREKGK